jgi:hypothetical protein
MWESDEIRRSLMVFLEAETDYLFAVAFLV